MSMYKNEIIIIIMYKSFRRLLYVIYISQKLSRASTDMSLLAVYSNVLIQQTLITLEKNHNVTLRSTIKGNVMI